MKQIFLILSIFVALRLSAQEPVVTWDGLKKQKEKSDEQIKDPEKAAKSATWAKRGKLYYDIAVFNYIPDGYKGMAATGGLQNVELYIGVPDKKEAKSDGIEAWIYPQKTLYMKDGKLDSWEYTDFIDKDAILKSAEAYIKAVETDEKGKFKSKQTTIAEVAAVRNNTYNDAITKYSAKDYKGALELMAKCAKLSEFPRSDEDSLFAVGTPHYAAGIIAREMKDYDTARKYFKASEELKYQTDLAYHQYADTYLAQGDSATYIAKVKEGFDKYTDSEQLVIDMINFYMDKKQPDMVVKYIDIALEKNPENASYYSAKGTIYDTQNDDFFKKYKEAMEEANEHKKAAFRDRFEVAKKAESEKKQAESLAKAADIKSKKVESMANAEKFYKQAIQTDKEFFNAIYNLGRLYYQAFDSEMYDSDYEFRVNKNSAEADKYSEKGTAWLKKSAETYEMAHKLKPKDRNTIEMLRSIYYKLKDYDKAKIYKEKLNDLPAESEPGIK